MHALGERRVDERAERLAQALALGQPGDHLVERPGQRAGLVGAEHRDADAEVAVGDARQALAQLGDRLEDRARQQHRHLQRDRERDDDRDQHADAERLAARMRARQAADDDAGDDADRGQRDQHPVAHRRRDRAQRDAVGQVERHVLEHRPHDRLEREEAHEHAVAAGRSSSRRAGSAATGCRGRARRSGRSRSGRR